MDVDLNDFLRGNDIMEDLGIKSRATLCSITQKVKKDDFEKNPELIEKTRGFKLIAVEELNGRFRYIRNFYNEYLLQQKKRRDIAQDVSLIEKSKSTVDILGINALGPIHSGREKLIDFLNKNGKVRILLLDPSSKAFSERERKEELHNGFIAGRLREEYRASIGICKDIINFTDFKKNIEIRGHDQTPHMALVISDRDEDHAVLNCNIYPLEDNVRGLTGRHKLNISKSDRESHFSEYIGHFVELWEGATAISEIESFIQQNRDKTKK